MVELLESIMLICFGCSWPMSVIRNIKAKSAKNMSFGFTMLIIAGYIAGICSKIYAHNFGYVLVVYFINLVFVSVNLVVYFINCSYDRKSDDKIKAKKIEKKPIKNEYTKMIAGGAN